MLPYIYNQCRVEQLHLLPSVWQNNQCITWTRINTQKYPLKYTLPTYNMGKTVLELTFNDNAAWNTILEHRHRASLVGYLWSVYISLGPTRNQCHKTAKDIMGKRMPTRILGSSTTGKIWSKTTSCLLNMKCSNTTLYASDEFMSYWKKHPKSLFVLLSSNCG